MQRHTLLLFWRASAQFPVRLTLSLLAPISAVLAGSFLGPYILAGFFNQLQAGDVRLDDSWGLVLAYALAQLHGDVVGWRIALHAAWRMEIAAQADLYRRTFSHLTRQSLGFHNDRFAGALVSQTTKFVGAYERFWDTVIFEAVPVVTSVLAASIILWFVFWQYALILFTLSVIYLAAVLISSRFMTRLTTLETQASTRLTGRLADVVGNIAAVKSFGRERDELDDYGRMVHSWMGRSRRTMRGFLGLTTVYSVLLLLLKTAALVAALVAVQQDAIAAGTVFLALTYTFTVSTNLWEVSHIVRNFTRAMGDAYDMTAILQLSPTVSDAPSAVELRSAQGGIEFEDVTFSHDPVHPGELFSRFQLSIAPGERVGLVGSSGSGKTTLTRLLLRFVDLQGGTIRIDGRDIARMRQADLRRAISYVPQEPMLFHRSLRENIAYGRPDASEEEVRDAAVRAHAWEFIAALPEGLDTLVGERGVKLSGGQRQRIAIARAILKDAPILLLDEATSALDSESEVAIQQALQSAMAGRTTIVIAHRLSTIRSLDRILLLEDGRIVEQGTHEHLLSADGRYAWLWTHQSGGFLGDTADRDTAAPESREETGAVAASH